MNGVEESGRESGVDRHGRRKKKNKWRKNKGGTLTVNKWLRAGWRKKKRKGRTRREKRRAKGREKENVGRRKKEEKKKGKRKGVESKRAVNRCEGDVNESEER